MIRASRRIEALEQCHSEVLALCDGLEAVADSLPHNVQKRICLTLAATLEPLIARTQALEEQALFPLLETIQNPQMARTMARLREEHLADHSAASEVSEALQDLGKDRSKLSPDAMGYLLRSFFVTMRRHVQSERDLIAMALPAEPGRGPTTDG